MTANISIQIQSQDFSLDEQYQRLRRDRKTGAIVTFVGLVRDFQTETSGLVTALELQHYPALANAQLRTIADAANQRWSLQAIDIIHRIGRLKTCDQIVYVGVAASHRQAAYESNQFIMDTLKSDVAFWKKIHAADDSYWLDANPQDQQLNSTPLPPELRTCGDSS